MAVTFLNLDQLSPKETREVQIGQRTYKIRETSVEDFIEATKAAEELQDETSYAKQLSTTIRLIRRAIPEIEETTLLALSLEQLKTLTGFIRGADVDTLLKEAGVTPQSEMSKDLPTEAQAEGNA